jgi:hypothetical protein
MVGDARLDGKLFRHIGGNGSFTQHIVKLILFTVPTMSLRIHAMFKRTHPCPMVSFPSGRFPSHPASVLLR